MQQPSLVEWLNTHVANSEARRLVDVYLLDVKGIEYRVETFDTESAGDYRYNVRVTDLVTGQSSDHGNGGPTPKEALDLFQWRSIIDRRE